MKKKRHPVKSMVDTLDNTFENEVKRTGKTVRTYQTTAIKRFPMLFTLAITFGIVATLFGFERVIMEIEWLNERPVLILSVGIATLIATGAFYKKLG